MIRIAALAAALTLASGCGLISSDIDDFDLSIDPKTFTVDTAQWEMDATMTSFPEIDCAGMAGICSQAVQEVCMSEACFGSCDGTFCEVKILVSLFTTVNLLDEHPELQEIDRVASVNIDAIEYDITENTLTLETPTLTLYVAPVTATSPGDAQALEVGTVPPIAPGMSGTGFQVDLSPEGRDNLRTYMDDFATPFNIIVGAEVDVMAGDPIPQGKLVTEVRVTAYADAI